MLFAIPVLTLILVHAQLAVLAITIGVEIISVIIVSTQVALALLVIRGAKVACLGIIVQVVFATDAPKQVAFVLPKIQVLVLVACLDIT